jgi:hypothetical protein
VEAARGATPSATEGRGEPELEPEWQQVVARLQRAGDVTGQVRKAGLLDLAMALLGRVAVRQPDRGPVARHRRLHHRGRPRRRGVVHHGLLAAEHPVVGGATLDPGPGLVGGDHLSATERRDGLRAPRLAIPSGCAEWNLWQTSPGLEAALGAAQQVHQPALAEGHAEQLGQCRL